MSMEWIEQEEKRGFREKSTRRQKVLLGCAVLLLLLQVGIYSLLVLAEKRKSAGETKEMLIENTADEIDGITFRAKDGSILSFALSDGRWGLQPAKCDFSMLPQETLPEGEPEAWKIREDAVRLLVSGVTGIAVRQIIEDPADLAEYGLAEPFTEAEIHLTDGTAVSLSISGTAASAQAVYVIRDGDGSRVFVCVPSIKNNFERTLSDFTDPEGGSEGGNS